MRSSIIGTDDGTNKLCQRSSNGGSAFSTVISSDIAARPNRICFAPSNTAMVYVGTEEGTLADGSHKHLWRSLDGGATFNSLAFNHLQVITDIVFDQNNNDVAYISASTTNGSLTADRGVWRTTAASGSPIWSLKNSGFTNKDIGAITINPTTSTMLFAGTYKDSTLFYQSTNSGTGWTVLTPSDQNNQVFDMRYSGTTLLAATAHGI